MKLPGLLIAGILLCPGAFAATDPFVGTWVYNIDKSPKPTINYTIKELGGGRYSLTGSTGTTVEVKADGVSIKTPAGATVSLQKLDARDWKMIRDDGQKMIRTYTISADDQTLTLHDVFAGNTADNHESTTKYKRLSPGHSIFGQWQSVSMEETAIGELPRLIITTYQTDGLSFDEPHRKHLSAIKFDGKLYADSGAGDSNGDSAWGKRINDHVLQIDHQVNERAQDRDELKVSDDGKTMTIVSRPANSSAVFTTVWDKQ